jgi:hypothetical protein
MTDDHPAYQQTRWLRQPVSTDSDVARLWRQHQEHTAEAESLQSGSRAERQRQIPAALDAARQDPACWWRLAVWLAAGDSSHSDEAVFSHDLTTRPGWPLLDGQERTDALDLGIRYLAAHQPQPSSWMGRARVQADQVVADWSGVYLLTTLAIHDPHRLAGAEPPVWRTWAPVIVSAWNSSGEEGEQARCDLVDLMPPVNNRAFLMPRSATWMHSKHTEATFPRTGYTITCARGSHRS